MRRASTGSGSDRIPHRPFALAIVWLALILSALSLRAQTWPAIEAGFRRPPAAARPMTLWFWMNGNVSRDGITRDLEAMSRVGLGGAIMFDGGTYLPAGSFGYLTPGWRELMTHAAREASRLGLTLGMHNGPGWSSSGGPWITPELSMKELVWTETTVSAGQLADVVLAQPETNEGFYRDAFVLAFPTSAGGARIEDWRYKANFRYRFGGQVKIPDVNETPANAAGAAIDPATVRDITANLDSDGRLRWDAPPLGDSAETPTWTILRIGYTSTGQKNVSASAAGTGLECDKFSRAAVDFHFDHVLGQILADVGPLAGRTFAAVEIDSYEAGMQNWSASFPDEFRRRAGYELWRYLPAMAGGRMVGDAAISERFLYDVRRVQADLMAENYYGRMQELCRQHGLKLYVEGYGQGVFDELQVSGRPDFPMTEFWERTPWTPNRVTKMVASAAHIYGKPVVAGESFTGEEKTGRWQAYPYALKIEGDYMFSLGLNKMIFHRFAHQPHPTAMPGMTMGPWGMHFDRTNTWFEQSTGWLDYLARCQYLLRQGHYVADVLYFVGERPPDVAESAMPVLPEGYNYDLINAEALLTRTRVSDGNIVLPNGASYRLLVLPPDLQAATPELMRHLRGLVQAGATVIGPKPRHSPTLRDFPASENEVRAIADELWVGDASANVDVDENPRAIANRPIADALRALKVAPDFTYASRAPDVAVSWIHRKLPEGDVYFVGNRQRRADELVASFRVSGRVPEIWQAETGEMKEAVVYRFEDDRTLVPLRLGPAESVFVVFRRPARERAPHWLAKDGLRIIDATTPAPAPPPGVTNTFTMAVWAKPDVDLRLMPSEGTTGRVDETGKFYAIPADEGDRRFGPGHATAGLAIGRNGIYVIERSSQKSPAVLVAPIPVAGWTHVAVVYRDGTPRLFVNGRFVKEGRRSGDIIHPGIGSPRPSPGTIYHFPALDRLFHASHLPSPPSHGRAFYHEGNLTTPQLFNEALGNERIAALHAEGLPPPKLSPIATLSRGADDNSDGAIEAELWESGTYTLDGGAPITVSVPEPQTLGGPWEVRFQEGRGAPPSITLPELISLHRHPDPGVKYFSGTATYAHSLKIAADDLQAGRRVVLDLGRVEVVAQVRINGRDVGLLWKAPYRIDLTDAVHVGTNELEIRVTNLWPNRLIGDEHLPPENEYESGEGRGIRRLPEWYVNGEPKPAGGRVTFATWKFFSADEPLYASGLLGPVRVLHPVRRRLAR